MFFRTGNGSLSTEIIGSFVIQSFSLIYFFLFATNQPTQNRTPFPLTRQRRLIWFKCIQMFKSYCFLKFEFKQTNKQDKWLFIFLIHLDTHRHSVTNTNTIFTDLIVKQSLRFVRMSVVGAASLVNHFCQVYTMFSIQHCLIDVVYQTQILVFHYDPLENCQSCDEPQCCVKLNKL